jgi:phosphate transport system permease protein
MSEPTSTPRRQRSRSSLLAQGTAAVWLTGSALTIALLMIVGLLALVLILGGRAFWPRAIVQVQTVDGKTYLGEVTHTETYRPTAESLAKLPPLVRERAQAQIDAAGGKAERRYFRTGNFEQTGYTFRWISDFEIVEESRPSWAVVLERQEYGNLYAVPHSFKLRPESEEGGKSRPFAVVADDPETVWELYEKHHPEVRARFKKWFGMKKEIAALNRRENDARLDVKKAELRHGVDSSQARKAREALDSVREEVRQESNQIDARMKELAQENDRYRLVMRISDGKLVEVKLDDIVRGYPANRLGWWDKVGVYFSRWGEFLTANPREANMEGGVLPAIWGTVVMTLLMSLFVVPFGVLAALYLREYAKSGPIISMVRIAINNLAGVPSIVYGIFGLGFFCVLIGGRIDALFYPQYVAENKPVFGTGGLLWASLTLALLTLPVVIVATEEALAAVPNSMREGSYACGASKWQTIWRIVLPRAMPGILTGMILAMARGAGEVAPLMVVGLQNDAAALPVDSEPPFVHPSRSFMHLGFHIFDLGFQSRDSDAARPMVYTTTLLLITIVALLNLTAMWLRARLRRRFEGGQF